MAHVSGDATATSTMPTAASIRATAAGDLIQASPGVPESTRPTAASIRATSAGGLIQAPPGVSETIWPCYAQYAPPALGLVGTEHVVRDGFVGRPMVMSGEEIGGVNDKEMVFRGGRLEKPHFLFGLTVISNKKCIKGQKTTRCST